MRLTVHIFGREVLSISTDRATDHVSGEHDLNCSTIELANEVPVGFRVQTNPSLREDPS